MNIHEKGLVYVEVDYMKNTWPDALERDPYYSPNLTKDGEDFSIGLN